MKQGGNYQPPNFQIFFLKALALIATPLPASVSLLEL